MKRYAALLLVVLLAGCVMLTPRPTATPDPRIAFCQGITAIHAPVDAGTNDINTWARDHFYTAPSDEASRRYQEQVAISQTALNDVYHLGACPACRAARDTYVAYLQTRLAYHAQLVYFRQTMRASDYDRACELWRDCQQRMLEAQDALAAVCCVP